MSDRVRGNCCVSGGNDITDKDLDKYIKLSIDVASQIMIALGELNNSGKANMLVTFPMVIQFMAQDFKANVDLEDWEEFKTNIERFFNGVELLGASEENKH